MEIPPLAFQASFEINYRKKWDILLQNPNSKVVLQILQNKHKRKNWAFPLGIIIRMTNMARLAGDISVTLHKAEQLVTSVPDVMKQL